MKAALFATILLVASLAPLPTTANDIIDLLRTAQEAEALQRVPTPEKETPQDPPALYLLSITFHTADITLTFKNFYNENEVARYHHHSYDYKQIQEADGWLIYQRTQSVSLTKFSKSWWRILWGKGRSLPTIRWDKEMAVGGAEKSASTTVDLTKRGTYAGHGTKYETFPASRCRIRHEIHQDQPSEIIVTCEDDFIMIAQALKQGQPLSFTAEIAPG